MFINFFRWLLQIIIKMYLFLLSSAGILVTKMKYATPNPVKPTTPMLNKLSTSSVIQTCTPIASKSTVLNKTPFGTHKVIAAKENSAVFNFITTSPQNITATSEYRRPSTSLLKSAIKNSLCITPKTTLISKIGGSANKSVHFVKRLHTGDSSARRSILSKSIRKSLPKIIDLMASPSSTLNESSFKTVNSTTTPTNLSKSTCYIGRPPSSLAKQLYTSTPAAKFGLRNLSNQKDSTSTSKAADNTKANDSTFSIEDENETRGKKILTTIFIQLSLSHLFF